MSNKWGEAYAHKAEVFASTPWWQNEAQETFKHINSRHDVILDVGCNMGAWERLARQKGHRQTIHAMDVNEYAVNSLKEQAMSGVITHTRLDTVPEGIDFVVMMHVINQIEDLESTLAEIWRKMKSGGKIVVVTHNPLINKFYWLKNKITGYKSDATMVREPRLGELSQLMYDNGFSNYDYYYFGDAKIPFLKKRLIYVGVKP